jgi:hypothetical protein
MEPKENEHKYTKEELDNLSNQLNSNNEAYYLSRGIEKPVVTEEELGGSEGPLWASEY